MSAYLVQQPETCSAEEPGSLANRRAQSHEQVLGGRLAATTSFTVNRMGKQQEEKLTGKGQLNLSWTVLLILSTGCTIVAFLFAPSGKKCLLWCFTETGTTCDRCF